MITEIRKCSRCGNIEKLQVNLTDYEDYILNRKLFKRFHFCEDNKGIGIEVIIAIEKNDQNDQNQNDQVDKKSKITK